MSFAGYARLRHATPYLVHVRRGARRLAVLGVRHSTEPHEPMFAAIEALFERLAPRFALHEGTEPALETDREIAIRRHGEAGLVRLLAARAGIRTASMDLPLPEEAHRLREAVGADAALVYLVVRQLASYNRKTARPDFAAYFGDFFSLIGPPLGLAIDWPLIERAHLALLGRPLATEAVTAADTDPLRDTLPTQRISRLSNRIRDEHMLAQLLATLHRHERVFATVGVSHAVMLEPALRSPAPRRD